MHYCLVVRASMPVHMHWGRGFYASRGPRLQQGMGTRSVFMESNEGKKRDRYPSHRTFGPAPEHLSQLVAWPSEPSVSVSVLVRDG